MLVTDGIYGQAGAGVIKKVVKKRSSKKANEIRENLEYWLSKTPEERIEAVEILRRQRYGGTARLQRVIRVSKQSQS